MPFTYSPNPLHTLSWLGPDSYSGMGCHFAGPVAVEVARGVLLSLAGTWQLLITLTVAAALSSLCGACLLSLVAQIKHGIGGIAVLL